MLKIKILEIHYLTSHYSRGWDFVQKFKFDENSNISDFFFWQKQENKSSKIFSNLGPFR